MNLTVDLHILISKSQITTMSVNLREKNKLKCPYNISCTFFLIKENEFFYIFLRKRKPANI